MNSEIRKANSELKRLLCEGKEGKTIQVNLANQDITPKKLAK